MWACFGYLQVSRVDFDAVLHGPGTVYVQDDGESLILNLASVGTGPEANSLRPVEVPSAVVAYLDRFRDEDGFDDYVADGIDGDGQPEWLHLSVVGGE